MVNEIPIEKWSTFLWTHSKIVLNYLNNNNDTKFGAHIAHRINEIRQSTTQIIGATSKQSEA